MTLDEIKALPKVEGDGALLDHYHDFIIDKSNEMSDRMEALLAFGNLIDPGENDVVSSIDVVEYTKCFTGNIDTLTSGT
jgi:uncharacterized alpha/beta hydrolase family protein